MKVVVLLSVLLLHFVSVCSFDFPEPPNYGWGEQTDLDRYVKSDDGFFTWSLINTTDLDNATFYVLNMTSQKWIDDEFSTRSIWWHYMGIAVPKALKRLDIAALFFMGGSNDDPPPTTELVESRIAVQAATDTGTICAYIQQVPNQPIQFYNDPNFEARYEDYIIAWSWISFSQFYGTPRHNTAYPLRNPMTKAAKRGMDAIHEFAKTIIPDSNIINFVASGPSKRGWTAFSIAMTDRRVIAIAPMVFSLIHMEESTMAHYKAMGGAWTFALEPYWRENLTQLMLEPIAYMPGGIYDFEDVYRYRKRLTIPKLSIASTGDEFFFPQDFHSWWVNMTEPKYLMMLPNAEHIMAPHYLRMYETIISFYEHILKDGGVSLPKVTWTRSEDTLGGEILFRTNPPPRINADTLEYDIEAWHSVTLSTDDRRDFRLVSADGPHPVPWNRTTVEEVEPGLFRSYLQRDLNGEWVGHFIEGTWEGPTGYRMSLTSEVNYVPYDYFPAVDCTSAAECYGSLV